MGIGIIDVGSNTVRLLAAVRTPSGAVEALREERAHLGLGEVIERHGRIPRRKLDETATYARSYAWLSRELGCGQIEVVVTAPARQSANAGELLAVLHRAVGVAPRALSAESEGRLAYRGALAAAGGPPAWAAVCDVGGGSTEIAIGASSAEAERVDSFDVGSLRLTHKYLRADMPSRKHVRAARDEVRRHLAALDCTEPQCAYATGGSARALRRLVGRTLGMDQLGEAVRMLTGRPPSKVARRHGIESRRADTLLAGAVILEGVCERLGVPFEVARGGLREGLAVELLSEPAAA
jgi:exopolyphosphatase / guanosine-5'-triphosphate,3'-diphosphate pyrophosphatase